MIKHLCVCLHLRCLKTHTGVLLEFVEEVLGRNKVVQQVAKTVMLIGGLQDREDLHKVIESLFA